MKTYNTEKTFIVKSTENIADDMKLINGYSRKELSPDDVYTFSVMLCDNDVDRDCERFAVESLFSLQELFLGKTGIFDHNPKAENQLARIYKTWVESVDDKVTVSGDQYFRLMAKAYIPITEASREIISRIDTGILKEVSVGCSVGSTVCSVCGEEHSSPKCSHRKGEVYDGTLCYGTLLNPIDAYEWSFVAVPAQRNAGVVKSFLKGEIDTENIISCLKSSGEITLNTDEKTRLIDYISTLEKQASDGRTYRKNLMKDVKKFALLSKCGISGNTLDSIIKALNIDELCELKKIYEENAAKCLPIVQVKPQTYSADDSFDSLGGNEEFTL
ncbi:MAG: hypothetical protein IJV39_05840 [Ruminococcus sp.]|nr:hypothetical protein [Ruminococcus sp.]